MNININWNLYLTIDENLNPAIYKVAEIRKKELKLSWGLPNDKKSKDINNLPNLFFYFHVHWVG